MTEYIHVGPEDRAEPRSHVIKLHGSEGFEGMRRAGRLAAEILDALVPQVIPGVTTDVTPILEGWHGDTSRMFLVGDVPIKAKKLVEVTYECLMLGLEQARPGNKLGDISNAIQSHAEKHRYGVVRDFCGHGLGRLFHDSPEVIHAGRPGTGPELKPGMFFTVEPMINIGRPDVKLLDDGWTAVTRDRSLSAQFEHSIGITDTGCEIFTKSPKGLDKPPY